MSLADRLERPGLVPRLRLLALAKAAVWRGDQDELAACVRTGRDRDDVARGDFEETLLQGVLFCGFPRAVTAFRTLEHHWPRDPNRRDHDGALPRAEQAAAGRALFDAIYADNAADVHTMLEAFHPEFHAFVLESAYGRILARPGLTPLERELLACAALAASDQVPQLIAHARGALRFGATRDELGEVVTTVVDAETAARLLTKV